VYIFTISKSSSSISSSVEPPLDRLLNFPGTDNLFPPSVFDIVARGAPSAASISLLSSLLSS